MPNTLAHIGIQSVLGRGAIRHASLHWILLSCIIPDLPWIFQRLLRSAPVEIDLISLRTYAIAQSSLVFCLILAISFAMLSRDPRRTFLILAFGATLHLVLDAMQTKWGNGVILVAPFDWTLINFDLFWPEQVPSYLLTAFGLGYIAYVWVREGPEPLPLPSFQPMRVLLTVSAFLVWVAGPVMFLTTIEAENLHDTQTLRSVSDRTDKPISVDRNAVVETVDGNHLLSHWTGEEWTLLIPTNPPSEGTISLRGQFVDATTIAVSEVKQHRNGLRGWFTYGGLLLILMWWLHGAVRAAVTARRH